MKKIFCYLFSIVIVINLLACYVPVYAAKMVNSVTVKGITAPVVGEHPKFTGISIKEDGIYINLIQWLDVDAGSTVMGEDDVFEVGKAYTLYMEIGVKSGYSFDSSLDYTKVTVDATEGLVNGENGTEAYLDGDSPNIRFTYWIPDPSNKRTVSFNSNGGEGTMSDVKVYVGDTYTLPECGFKAPSGQRFKEWYILSSGDDTINGHLMSPGDEITIKENVTIEAVWESNGTVDEDEAKEEGFDDDHIIKSFEITGIKKPAKDVVQSISGIGIKAVSISGKDVSAHVILTPQWESKTQEKVLDDGEKFVEGHTYLLYIQMTPDEGYAFSTKTSYEASEKADSMEAYLDNSPADIRLTYKIASEEHANDWLISFSPANGNGKKDPVYVEKNSTFTVPENPFTAPDGYEFDKWYVDGVYMNPGETFIVTKDVLLTASWKVDQAKREENYNKKGWFASYEGFDFYRDEDGNVRCYDSAGMPVKNEFKCDGEFTYYFQLDGTAMKDRLTYHPDGVHVIYFDSEGHEVFSDFANVKKTIAGDEVDDYCFFNVFGYMYVDVVTYDKSGLVLYYANAYGVLERGKWFQFSDYVTWADGREGTEFVGGYGYANEDGTLLTNTATYDWEGRSCYLQGNGVAAY